MSKRERRSQVGDRLFLDYVRAGCLELDGEGRIWRIAVRLPAGGVASCKRERADHRRYDGYYMLKLYDGHSRRYIVPAHRAYFLLRDGAIPDHMVVDHINGNPSDNRPANLRLATYAENGLRCKLTPDQVRAIRASTVPPIDLAPLYGVDPTTISRVRSRTRYARVPDVGPVDPIPDVVAPPSRRRPRPGAQPAKPCAECGEPAKPLRRGLCGRCDARQRYWRSKRKEEGA